MADVFISYSRDDRARVRLIAETLGAEGLSVWWDPEILPGTTFDEVIDRELDAAKCVIVAWSEKSRQSRWVREEANDALEREILIPVLIEPVPLPRGFKLVQTENLSDWQGDRAADAWQRIMLQVSALTGKRVVPPPGPKHPKQRLIGSATGGGHSATTEAPASKGMDFSVVIAALIVGGIWFFGAEKQNAYWAGTAALAGFAFILFRFADSDLSPSLKAIASRWFLPVDGKVQVSSIEAFNNMFEAVFGQKQLSWKCFWRSAAASTISFSIILLYLDHLFNKSDITDQLWLYNSTYIRVFLTYIVINISGDFFSLWETRLLLRLAVKHPRFLAPIVVSDAVLTFLLFAGFMISMILFLIFVGAPTRADFQSELTARVYLLSSVATAYITSIWLWLALVFGPIARLVVWSRRTGLTAVGRLLDAQQKPFTALGYVAAGVILFIGAGLWIVQTALAA